MLRNLRRTSQAIFLLIFLYLFLQTESKGANDIGYPVKVFLDADPLLWLTTLLATRSPERILSLALIVIVATILLGRVFCGWVCPLGTVHTLASWSRKYLRRTPPRRRAAGRRESGRDRCPAGARAAVACFRIA
jgi:polyferredoxin